MSPIVSHHCLTPLSHPLSDKRQQKDTFSLMSGICNGAFVGGDTSLLCVRLTVCVMGVDDARPPLT